MLTVKEVSQRLNVSEAMVYKLVRSGDLSAYRIGKTIRFSEEQIAEYLEQRLVDGRVEAVDIKNLISKHLDA